MSVIHFPNQHPVCRSSAAESTESDKQTLRDFALNIAAQLRDDPELNKQAPYLVDKVILLLMKESRG
ncbi:hypothetical protein VH86_15085 [Pantoea sp. BL1]|uniref:Uncharacterized protein n=1 Tax=Pantoea rwandensis TaxID=1076550 RepID=A0ABM5RKI7_9GAMM|nr:MULTISPECIES: hypothetical protein [Erwiniaceae]AIR86298.1 hypothetical protein LH22_12835 [Pantoea rwandensis]KJV47623.1 hypothetical protein VH86_15085 [Pantoea sp. BL1]MBK0092956.1 hypothetical protein [Erwinia sp. S59]